jgi:hypothetical protein
MSDLLDPFTPSDCDLRGMPYMPLDVVRMFDSDFYVLSTGDEFKAGVSLWGKAFLQVPAGSLPKDDRLLAHLSGAGSAWRKVKEMALRGWVECSDGRLYHRTVAEKCLEAWKARCDKRARTEAARAARQTARANCSSEPPQSVTEVVTVSVTDNATEDVTDIAASSVTVSVTDIVTGSKGREGKGREDKKEEDSPSLRSGPPNVPLPIRDALWRDGIPILCSLLGKSDRQSRAFLGGLLKAGRDDCARIYNALREAESLRPIDPAAWLTRACGVQAPKTPPPKMAHLAAAYGIGPPRDVPAFDLDLQPEPVA